MPRKLRVQFEGAIYHVTVRCNGRRKIFLDGRDRTDLTQREAGRILGYKMGTAVSMQLKRLRKKLEETGIIQKRVARIEKKLKAFNN